ncbi:MAG: hypothetical protein QOI98_395 [Solirubrobacteraceae bacterium]|nr:hypothetical protein [Solirubrobacteraceae bacterium]
MKDRVKEAIHSARVPGETQAAQRSWDVVSAAYRELGAPRGRRRPVGRLAVGVAVCVALVVGALTPPGPALARWIKHAIDLGDSGVPHARHALSRLPSPGRLLTAGAGGAAIVQADGSRRFLGPYREASWSPRGLFVVGVRGRQLVAVDPLGRVRWAITPPGRVSDPRWSPDGFRIAYRSAGTLRVVIGNGTGDRLLARHARPGTPAWRPGAPHTLAWADDHGRLVVADVDLGITFRSALGGVRVPVDTRTLEWSSDGARVYALTRHDLRVWTIATARVRRLALPPGGIGVDLATQPGGARLALIEVDRLRHHSEIFVLGPRGSAKGARRLFGAAGLLDGLRWSPDGRWLLAAWRAADQWVFVRVASRPQITAVAGVARQLDPAARGRATFPRVEGWCCAIGSPAG